MTAANARSRDRRGRLRALTRAAFLLVLSLVLAVMLALAMRMGAGVLTRFRLRNATGEEVAVTSTHTQKTVHISNQDVASVPHTRGDIIVTMPDGKTWVHRNISPLDLKGTPFAVKEDYTFFAVEDGYVVCGSWTVDLLLDKNGRLYAILPDVEDVDVGKLTQPQGFPLKPETDTSQN